MNHPVFTTLPPAPVLVIAISLTAIFTGIWFVIRWERKRWPPQLGDLAIGDRVVDWFQDPHVKHDGQTGYYRYGAVMGMRPNEHDASNPIYAVQLDHDRSVEWIASSRLVRESTFNAELDYR